MKTNLSHEAGDSIVAVIQVGENGLIYSYGDNNSVHAEPGSFWKMTLTPASEEDWEAQ